jgi:hypothetical protein
MSPASLRSHSKFALLLVVALSVALLLVGCRKPGADAKPSSAENSSEGQPKEAAARITVENGQALITLDEPTQKRLGLAVSTLRSTVSRAQAVFPAVVLSVQEIPAQRSALVTADTQIKKTQIQLDVERTEYERLKMLSSSDQNVARKLVEAAEASVHADEAELQAGTEQRSLQQDSLRQTWGEIVGQWIVVGAPQLRELLDHRQSLIQLTLPAGYGSPPPESIALEAPGGARLEAAYLSGYPHLDPRVQGRSYLYGTKLYATKAAADLAPGLSLAAHLPIGGELRGVVIPASAVVWSEGKAWVYTQAGEGRFSRSPLSTDIPVEGGYFAAQGFAPGDRVVTVGAQALLSEELLLHSQGGGDEN